MNLGVPRLALRFAVLAVSSAFALVASAAALRPQPLTEQHIEALEKRVAPGTKIALQRVTVPGGDEVTLELEAFDVFARDAQIVVHGVSGDVVLPPPSRQSFRGRVKGEPESVVYVAAGGGRIRGVIVTPENGFVIDSVEPAPSATSTSASSRAEVTVRVLDAGAFVEREHWKCDTIEPAREGRPRIEPDAVASEALAPPVGTKFRLAIETDYPLFQFFQSSTANLSAYVADVVGTSAVIQQRDLGVDLEVGHLSIWSTDTDPYTATSSMDAIRQLQSYWNTKNIERDVVYYLSGQVNDGGRASYDTICDSSFRSVAVNGNISGNTSATEYVWDTKVFTHELGHNLGSKHTHCYSPVVDQCYSGEAGCYSGPTSLPPQGGTIMSYCHLISSNGVKMLLGAEGQPSEAVLQRLRSNVASRVLQGAITVAPTICANATATASVSTANAGEYVWTITNGTILSGNGTSSVQFRSGSSGIVELRVTVSEQDHCTARFEQRVQILSANGVAIETMRGACTNATGNTASVVDAGTGATYAWTIANGTITSAANARIVTFTAPASGSITLSVSVTKGGCTGTGTKSLTVGPPASQSSPPTPPSMQGRRRTTPPFPMPAPARRIRGRSRTAGSARAMERERSSSRQGALAP